MSDWSEGYVAEIGYTYGYYGELNPLRARLALLQRGLAIPAGGAACELGFGQGLSIAVHAAAAPERWYGTDFNPSQAGFARQMLQGTGVSAELRDQSFEQFCQRDDLPEFSFIGLHGIWSWISDHNRQLIVDFIGRKLAVGGLLYISYNTQPGWAATVPLRDLLVQHSDRMSASGQSVATRIDSALAFTERLFAADPAYSRVNPSIKERLKTIAGQDRHYLAHEYFNSDWAPMSFAGMQQWLGQAKMNFACSANFAELIDSICFSEQQLQLLAEIPDPTFKQTVRDFMLNAQFRKDYWIKGARELTPFEQLAQLRELRFVLLTPPAKVPLAFRSARGEVSMDPEVYGRVLEVLADHRPHSFAELEAVLRGTKVRNSLLVQSLLVLVHGGHVVPAQDDAAIEAARAPVAAFNRNLLDLALKGRDLGTLASPVTGGGVGLNRIEQIFLAELQRGQQEPAKLAEAAWALLNAAGQRLKKDGKPLETAEENMASLVARAEDFMNVRLPSLRALLLV